MRKLIIIFTISSFVVIFLNSCDILDSPEYMHNLWADVDSVEVETIENAKVTFNCLTSVGDPCHEFDRLEVSEGGDTIYVRLYSKREMSKTCITVVVTKEFEITVDATRNKTNYFKFWRIDSYNKVVELFVP